MQLKKSASFPIFYSFAKCCFLFTVSVYLLALPGFAFGMAFPGGFADALLPYEVFLCFALSGACLVWSGVEFKRLIVRLKK